ncbi:MAG: DegQ family serine endoprotease [Steroidobacteraceae bacterium]
MQIRNTQKTTLPPLLREALAMSSRPAARRVLGATLAVFALSACSPQASTAAGSGAAAVPGRDAAVAAPLAPPAAIDATGRALPDFTALVERYGPAVVNVATVQRRQRVTDIPGLSPEDPFYEFFRRFQGPRGNQPSPRGEGSGFIVSADGYILTNAHVVDDASDVTVKLTDRREYSAKVIGLDKRTDVAVLKIEATDLPTVRLGDPDRLRPGEWVIAIGSPFGFDNSVTAGIVSAKSRSLPGEDSNYVPFIQTDVAVNPGNSGGPLFNLAGEVVGINSQIYSRTGGYMGLSFAIPIDLASDIKDQLVKTGKVSRGRIGVSIQDVNAQFAESFGLDRPRGALVGSVDDGGPADQGGVKPGDIILSANGRSIERSSELPAIIAGIRPGTEASLEVWRDRATRSLKVKVGELEESTARIASRSEGSSPESDKLGLVVRELSAAEQRQGGTRGALLVQDADGPAAEAGVRRGDVILGVNGRRVKSLKELQDATTRSGKTVALLIQRDDAQIFVPVRLP